MSNFEDMEIAGRFLRKRVMTGEKVAGILEPIGSRMTIVSLAEIFGDKSSKMTVKIKKCGKWR